jgi:hypothetical protein
MSSMASIMTIECDTEIRCYKRYDDRTASSRGLSYHSRTHPYPLCHKAEFAYPSFEIQNDFRAVMPLVMSTSIFLVVIRSSITLVYTRPANSSDSSVYYDQGSIDPVVNKMARSLNWLLMTCVTARTHLHLYAFDTLMLVLSLTELGL